MSETTEFYTVIYRVTGNKDVHDVWWQDKRRLLHENAPVRVTGIAKFDALERLDNLAEEMEGSSGG